MSEFIKAASELPRSTKVALQILLDFALVVMAFSLAMLFRLESLKFFNNPEIWCTLFSSAVTGIVCFWALGLYRTLVRFITGRILIVVSKGALVAGGALYAASVLFEAPVPRSVPFIYIVFVVLFVSGVRFGARNVFRLLSASKKQPVLIYGAGQAGLQLLNALFHGREYAPVALIDDDPKLQNLAVGGLRVFSPDEITRLVQETGARLVLLAIPSVGRARRMEIVAALSGQNLDIKTIPGMSDIISGKAQISELKAVSIEDLLGREPVAPDRELLGRNITDRVVMVTGAGGSIGSELCRQILTERPSALVLYEISEFALYAIEAELSEKLLSLGGNTKIVALLGSVQDVRRVTAVIEAFGVETLYHAAAYKHVPIVEENVFEGIRNNVFGTLVVANAARDLGVANFILISTDKAVRPTNVMGATKRIAELICQACAREGSATKFSMVRFGNVLGSSGSVIPKFRAQIESGGPVTVTHREITRYFMTIPEAAQLVIQAGAMARGGDVFVLDMGQPIKIVDLAFSMVRLHGLRPYLVERVEQEAPEQGDIAVLVTGLRKGEKLYEELMIGNCPSKTSHPRIMTATEVSLSSALLQPILDRLRTACDASDLLTVLSILDELPLDYRALNREASDLLWTARQASAVHSSNAVIAT